MITVPFGKSLLDQQPAVSNLCALSQICGISAVPHGTVIKLASCSKSMCATPTVHCQCSGLSKSSLQAWTSTIAVDVYPEGPVHTQRLDMLVGTGHGYKGTPAFAWVPSAAL